MALTREYRETVIERIKQDKEFAAALFAEGISSLIEGDKATTLSIMRDLVHAYISFKTLAKQTGFDEKALHRMLSVKGNPTMKNLTILIHTIENDLQLSIKVTAQQTETMKKPLSRREKQTITYK
ncbi:hypothetical protein ES703_81537 [subsurface metagenome]